VSSLKTLEKQPFEELLEMAGGYVLHFTNQTFASFFTESVSCDIYADCYATYGDSKAKRLRAFWERESDPIVGKVLSELLDLWEYQNPQATADQKTKLVRGRQVVARLLGRAPAASEVTEDQFLHRQYKDVSINKVPIEQALVPILEARYEEANRCLQGRAPLAAIFLCGSILEGLLLGTALTNQQSFNQATCSPKDKTGKVKQFQEWTLANFIDVACELGFLRLDVKKFSHSLRDFRNYIHPYQQMSTRFNPDHHTAEICVQVLRAAIASLGGQRGQ
jgi:hypothetical protein